MARGIGCVEFADGMRKYFVHCETSGGIYSTLFSSPKEAQASYRRIGAESTATIKTDRQVAVVKFARASGWDDDNSLQWEFDRYGLATKEAFLGPMHEHESYRCIQLVDNTLHVGQMIDGGFGGQYAAPICEIERDGAACDYNPDAKEYAYEEMFGKPLCLCDECAGLLID